MISSNTIIMSGNESMFQLPNIECSNCIFQFKKKPKTTTDALAFLRIIIREKTHLKTGQNQINK
jgi:hypothetical protein